MTEHALQIDGQLHSIQRSFARKYEKEKKLIFGG